jgi:hypothetical protein
VVQSTWEKREKWGKIELLFKTYKKGIFLITPILKMFTTTRTCDNTPYHSDEEEESVTYHSNPERFRQLKPNSRAEQAYLFCIECKQWKKLSSDNIKTIDYRLFSFHKQYYSSGSCLTDECYDEIERKIKTEQRIEEKDKSFWNQVDIMEKRCDESQKRSDAIWKNAIQLTK